MEKEEDDLLREISTSTVKKNGSEKPTPIITTNEANTKKEAEDEEDEEEDEDVIEQFLRQAMIAKRLMAASEDPAQAKHKIHAVVPGGKKGTDSVEELDSDEEDEDDDDESGDFDVLSPKQTLMAGLTRLADQ
jgi:hypothetical protein